MANDHLQKLREAVVSVLDANAALVAITGRATDNIVAWDNLGDSDPASRSSGIVAYFVLPGRAIAADQNAEEWTIQFAAVATEESTANELVWALLNALTGDAFQTLAPPLDATQQGWTRRPMPPDPDEELARADIDITFRVYF